jgi:hypothetical protein
MTGVRAQTCGQIWPWLWCPWRCTLGFSLSTVEPKLC